MKHTRNAARVIFALLWILLPVVGGCAGAPCEHQWGSLQAAVRADLFETGTIAHYQCAHCGALADEHKTQVETVTVPKLPPQLFICVNGEPTELALAEQEAGHITWTLDDLAVNREDVITLKDTAGHEYPFTAALGSNLDGQGQVLNTTATAFVSVTATPQSMTLTLENREHPGIVVQINGTAYPMCLTACHDSQSDTYLYGYAQLHAGDRLTVIDNVNDTVYDYDDLADTLRWNTTDFHRGETGEFVMDDDGRYVLEFSKDGNRQIYLTKTFGPTSDEAYRIHFGIGGTAHAPLEDTLLASDSALFHDFAWYVDDENTVNDSDIADHIAKNGLHVYSAALYLEAGTQFYIENTAASVVITGDHLTQVLGAADCFRLNGQLIEITQNGTYHIRYLPSHGSISLEQLSTGSVAQAAKEFDMRIAALPSKLELYYREDILQLYRQYQKLPSVIRSQLKASAKLEALHQNAVASSGTLYYMNTQRTNHVYRSREELREAFYTDFYYYIAACHGTARLRSNGIKNAADFIKLAKVSPEAEETDFYEIGFVAGRYLLTSDSNGIAANQSENTFIGFCYHNGLYQEILPFLSRYFAYWRIDEGYATASNCGADLFAEGWAPTVDITKFFCFDENTSPVRTARMIDCFTNTAGVVYGFEPAEVLPDIRLRGYIFEGWYDNPQFSGEPVTETDPAHMPAALYAKWSMDTQQQDRDAAALVDVYIHNLSTQAATRNPVTVGYAKTMYGALSDSGKRLVENYPVLQKFIAQYIRAN